MPTTTLNISSTTFVSSAQPDNNLSFYPTMYVGLDPAFQNCISLLQVTLPPLPVTQVDSAKLQFAVIVKSGAAPSPVVVNRVTAPFNTATVTYNTRPPFTATPSQINVTTADLYTTVQLDVTALVNSWLDGTFTNDGIALTNSDGTTVVQFATNNIGYQPYFPELILTYSSSPASLDVNIVGRKVDTAHEVVTATDTDQRSIARDTSQKTLVSFFVTNIGPNNADVGVEESTDGINYISQNQNTVSVGETAVFIPQYYSAFARLFYHANNLGESTTLSIDYIAQT